MRLYSGALFRSPISVLCKELFCWKGTAPKIFRTIVILPRTGWSPGIKSYARYNRHYFAGVVSVLCHLSRLVNFALLFPITPLKSYSSYHQPTSRNSVTFYMFPVLFLVPRPPTSLPPLRVWGGLSWESCKSVPGYYGDIEDTCSQSKASTYTCAFKITSGYTQERISSFSLVKQISFLHNHAPRPTVTSLHAVLHFLFAQQQNFCNSIEGKPSFSLQRETLNQTAIYTNLFSATEAAA